MTDNNATPANKPARLADCQTDAILLHGLVQALEEVEGNGTKQARNGAASLIVVIERMADKLSTDLEYVKEVKADLSTRLPDDSPLLARAD